MQQSIKPNKKNQRPNKTTYTISLFFMMVNLAVLYFFEKAFENTINGFEFFCLTTIIGLFLGFIVSSLFRKLFPNLYFNSLKNMGISLHISIGITALTLITAVIYNNSSNETPECNSYVIERKDTMGSFKRERYQREIIFVRIKGIHERIQINKNLWSQIQQNGEIQICIIKGKLGYYFISGLKK